MSATEETQAHPIPPAPTPSQRWLPIVDWIPRYAWRDNLLPDVVAALSVSALLIPESLGYASVAGAPIQLGLYAAPLAIVAYALLGGSRILVVGASGAVAAMSASVMGDLSGETSAAALSMVLAFATGAVFLAAGLLRLGWLTHFMSTAVVDGFITGLAIHIIVGQLAGLSGADLGDGNVPERLYQLFASFEKWSGLAFAVGGIALASMLALGRVAPRVPSALIAVVLGSLGVAVLGWDLDLVKKIPAGIPPLTVPSDVDLATWAEALAGGALIALVGFSEGWGASLSISEKTHDSLDSNQEFRAYGVANLGSGLLGGIAVSGSLSKSEVALTSGARTQLSNLLVAGIVLLTLAFLHDTFQWLPETILAAIVIHAMWRSANPAKIVRFWRIEKVDFVLSLVTGLAVIFLDLLPAMAIGVALSTAYLVYRISFPGRAVLGRQPDTGDFVATREIVLGRDEPTGADAEDVPGVLIYRFEAPLIFSNAHVFNQTIERLLLEAQGDDALPRALVVDFEEILYLDADGVEAVRRLLRHLARYGIEPLFARVHGRARGTLTDSGVLHGLGEAHLFSTVRAAVAAAEARQSP